MSPEKKIDADAPETEDLLRALRFVKTGATTRFLDNHDPKAEMVPGLRARVELNEGEVAKLVFEHEDPKELKRFLKMIGMEDTDGQGEKPRRLPPLDGRGTPKGLE